MHDHTTDDQAKGMDMHVEKDHALDENIMSVQEYNDDMDEEKDYPMAGPEQMCDGNVHEGLDVELSTDDEVTLGVTDEKS